MKEKRSTQLTAVVERRNLADLKPHPLQPQYFPDLAEHELRALANDIRKHGLRQRIEILPNGTILQGHQRRRALQLNGISATKVLVRHDLDGADEATIELEFLRDNQHRRHSTPLAKARAAVRLLEIERDRPRGSLLDDQNTEARDRVGEIIGMSGRHLSRYLRILATPIEVQRAFECGKLSLVDADRVAGLDRRVQEQIARQFDSAKDVKALLAKFLGKQRRGHRNINNAVAAFAKALERAVDDLGQRMEEVRPAVVLHHAKQLKQGRKMIRQLLERIDNP